MGTEKSDLIPTNKGAALVKRTIGETLALLTVAAALAIVSVPVFAHHGEVEDGKRIQKFIPANGGQSDGQPKGVLASQRCRRDPG